MWEESKHPRDNDGKFTDGNNFGGSNNGDKLLRAVTEYEHNTFGKGKSIGNNGKFVKIGETSITQPEKQNDVFNGGDKYPQTTSAYKFVKKAENGVVEINLDADIQKQFDKATPKERTKIAYKYIKDNLRGTYQAENGVEVLIQESSANKISHTLYETKIRTSPQLADLIKQSKYQKTEKALEHKRFNRFIYYDVLIKIKDKTYTALLNIGVNNNQECVLYDINKFIEK